MKYNLSKQGTHKVGRKQADIVGNEIDRLIASLGRQVTPHDVVNSAKNPGSPLHKYFEWNNTKAGNAWRIEQARNLLQWVMIEVSPGKEVRAFVNVKQNNKNFYVTIDRALNDKVLRKQMLAQAVSEILFWKNKYQTLKELRPVFWAIKKIKKFKS